MADVSHELRTPLTTINGVIQGIKNDMIPEDRKRKKDAVSEQRNKSSHSACE